MKKPALILCGVNLRSGGDDAIRAADAWAKLFKARLAFAHVIPETTRTHILFPQLAQRTVDGMPALMALAAEALAGRVESLTGRTRSGFEIRVDVGSPAAALVVLAEEMGADTIVLGATGDESSIGPLGPVALRVVQHAHVPVLVARAAGSGGVLAASDLSDPRYPAIAAGASVASASGVPLAVVHVAEMPLPAHPGPLANGFGLGYEGTAEERQLLKEAARDRLNSAMARLGVAAAASVEEGIPAVSIVAAARRMNASLLVIGTEGRTGLRRILLGSTAENVLRDAPCPVLVVRLHLEGS